MSIRMSADILWVTVSEGLQCLLFGGNLPALPPEIHTQPHERGAVIISTLQMRMLQHREAQELPGYPVIVSPGFEFGESCCRI